MHRERKKGITVRSHCRVLICEADESLEKQTYVKLVSSYDAPSRLAEGFIIDHGSFRHGPWRTHNKCSEESRIVDG